MAIDYTFREDKRLVLVVWDQVVTLDQWISQVDRMYAQPEYARADAQLVDLRYSTLASSITDADIRGLIERLRPRRVLSGKRLAMVAGPEWEKAKLVERLIEPLNVRPIVFANLITACTWLDLDVVEIGNEFKEMRLKMRGAPQ